MRSSGRRHLCRILVDKGYSVAALVRKSSNVDELKNLGVKPVVGVDAWIQNEAERDKPHRDLLICKNRKGDVVDEWEAKAGSLILLRAPGFAGEEDGRPFHMVEGPKRGQRYSVAFRMDTK